MHEAGGAFEEDWNWLVHFRKKEDWHILRAMIRVEAQGALFGKVRVEIKCTPKRMTWSLNLC